MRERALPTLSLVWPSIPTGASPIERAGTGTSMLVATERPQSGSVKASGLLPNAVFVGNEAGEFKIG
jgi:hypothetical protein